MMKNNRPIRMYLDGELQVHNFRCDLLSLRKKKTIQRCLLSTAIIGLSMSSTFSSDILPTGDNVEGDLTNLEAKSEIRKRTDKYAEMDRKASLSHFEKLRNEGNAKGLSDLNRKASPTPDNASNALAPLAQSESDKSSELPSTDSSSNIRTLHIGPCSPCELASEYPAEAIYSSPGLSSEQAPGNSIRSQNLPPSPAPILPKQTSSPNSAQPNVVQAAAVSNRGSRLQSSSSQSPSTRLREFDQESTTKPSLPKNRSIAPAQTARSRSTDEPVRIGSLSGVELETLREEDRPSVSGRVTLLPPPTISPIPPEARNTRKLDSDLLPSQNHSSNERIYRPVSHTLTSLSTMTQEPLRIGSIQDPLESSDYRSGFATQSPSLPPAILDQESLASPSLSSSSTPFASQNLSSPSDSIVVPAAFQSGAPFGVPPSNLNGSGVVQPSLPPPGMNAPIYPSTPTYNPPPVSNQIYPAPSVTGPSTSSVPGLSPQSSYGLPSYPSQRNSTITSGEPFVTAAPRQFDACYMVEPTYSNAGCGAPPLANTPPYSGIPGTVIPPTYMPNQVPPGLYPQGNSGYRPLIGFGQQNYNVQLGRGIFGQPKAYVPGQYVRNFLRYFTL